MREKEISPFLEKKLSLFQEYLSVTKRIKEAFVDEGEGNPGAFIAERQGLIENIEKIDSSIEKVLREGMAQTGSGFGIYNETIKTRLQDIKIIMETVRPMDEELIVVVREEEEQARESLLIMQRTRQAVNGYQTMGKSSPKFLDALR